LFLIKEKKVSRPTFVQVVCALRFFYTHTLNRKISMERIPFPRRERKLPVILSREEVKALLAAPGNLRTRTLLSILYRCGLRVSEVAQLKVSDIDSARNVLRVRQGKGGQDRQTFYPPSCWSCCAATGATSDPAAGCFPQRTRPDPSR
jgi:integrase/recombinase XerD